MRVDGQHLWVVNAAAGTGDHVVADELSDR